MFETLIKHQRQQEIFLSCPHFFLFFTYKSGKKTQIDKIFINESNMREKRREIDFKYKDVRWLDTDLEKTINDARIHYTSLIQHHNNSVNIIHVNEFESEIDGLVIEKCGKYVYDWRFWKQDNEMHFFPRDIFKSLCGIIPGKDNPFGYWQLRTSLENSSDGKCPKCFKLFKEFRDGNKIYDPIEGILK